MNEPAPVNPYASPAASSYRSPLAPAATYDGGIWKRDRHLIMHRRAHLPAICIKTGQPVTSFRKYSLFWYPSWCYFGLLMGGLPFIILCLLFGKHARVEVGLCDAWAQRMRRQSIAGLVMLVAGALLMAVCIALAYAEQYWMLLGVFPAVILIVLGVGILIFGGSPVAAGKITQEYVHLRGVGRSVRERFPDWPYR